MHSVRSATLRFAIPMAIACAAPHAHATGHRSARNPARYLVVTNASFDSVVSLAVAPDDGNAYRTLDIGRPLQGGLNSITVELPPGGCMRRFRVTFANGAILRIPYFDLCRFHQLRLSVPPG